MILCLWVFTKQGSSYHLDLALYQRVAAAVSLFVDSIQLFLSSDPVLEEMKWSSWHSSEALHFWRSFNWNAALSECILTNFLVIFLSGMSIHFQGIIVILSINHNLKIIINVGLPFSRNVINHSLEPHRHIQMIAVVARWLIATERVIWHIFCTGFR